MSSGYVFTLFSCRLTCGLTLVAPIVYIEHTNRGIVTQNIANNYYPFKGYLVIKSFRVSKLPLLWAMIVLSKIHFF